MAGKKERGETFERARKLLMGAVDTVLEIATIDRDGKKCERDAEATSSNPMSMTTSTSSISSPAVSEHKRLFGFKHIARNPKASPSSIVVNLSRPQNPPGEENVFACVIAITNGN